MKYRKQENITTNKCTQYFFIRKKYEKKINRMENYMNFCLSTILKKMQKHSFDDYIMELKYDIDKTIVINHNKNIEEMIKLQIEENIDKMFDDKMDDIVDDLKYRIQSLKEEMQYKYLLKFLGDSSDSSDSEN